MDPIAIEDSVLAFSNVFPLTAVPKNDETAEFFFPIIPKAESSQFRWITW